MQRLTGLKNYTTKSLHYSETKRDLDTDITIDDKSDKDIDINTEDKSDKDIDLNTNDRI